MYYFIKHYRAWILFTLVSIISIILWLMTLSGNVRSTYQFFPIQRFIDTGLLPPESYVSYVGPLRAWAVVIAIAALITFLLYDVLKRFRSRLIKRGIWPYFSLFQAGAMIAIFVHGFTLGTSMNSAYFILWWIFLGVILLPCLGRQVLRDFQASCSRKRAKV